MRDRFLQGLGEHLRASAPVLPLLITKNELRGYLNSDAKKVFAVNAKALYRGMVYWSKKR
jgi:hypothetical protein